MKFKRNKCLVVVSLGACLLTACGGSSDDGAGQLSQFQVVPDEVNIQSDVTTCPLSKAGDFIVIGGTAPYTVSSSYTGAGNGVSFGPGDSLAPTSQGTYTVGNRNGRFAVFIAGCFDPATVTIRDALNREPAFITISYAASAAST
jgi:hypothetical protein